MNFVRNGDQPDGIGPNGVYLTDDPRVRHVRPVVAAGDSFQALKPRLWTERGIGTTSANGPFGRSYDLTADGKHIITWDPDEARDSVKTNLHITVLTNWFGEVERRFAHTGAEALLCLG